MRANLSALSSDCRLGNDWIAVDGAALGGRRTQGVVLHRRIVSFEFIKCDLDKLIMALGSLCSWDKCRHAKEL